VSRARAQAIALKALKPQRLSGSVAMFGLAKPLEAKTRISQLGSPGLRAGNVAQPTVRLRRPAWLIWEDRRFQSLFEHPSTMLLIDAKSGRIVKRQNMSMFPIVNGSPPAFVASNAGYHSKRYIFFLKGVAPPKTSAAGVFAQPAATPPRALAARPNLTGDCLITVGDRFTLGHNGPLRGKPILLGSFQAIEHWADSVGLPRTVATHSEDLANEVDAVTKKGCRDVFIFLAGHGVPPPGLRDESGNEIPGGPAGVHLGWRLVGFDKRGNDIYKDDFVRPVDIAKILDAHPSIEFKLKIETCFAGRFAEDELPDHTRLPDRRNLRVMEMSSSATQSSQAQMFKYTVNRQTGRVLSVDPIISDNPYGAGEFTNGDVHGLETWANSDQEQAEHPGLAGGIARSAELGKPFNAAVQTDDAQHHTDIQVTENPPLPEPEPEQSGPPFAVGPSGGFDHTQRFDATHASTVCAETTTSPPQPGATVKAQLFRINPDGSATALGDPQDQPPLDANGAGKQRLGINDYGDYRIVVTITSHDGTVPGETVKIPAQKPPPDKGGVAC
jgi:hypothetical protein